MKRWSLDPQWRAILKRAWSIRLMAVAGVLSGAEAVLPMFGDLIPRGWFAVLNFAVVAAALVARIVAQETLDG